MSKLEEDFQAVAFISLDGLSFMVPVTMLPFSPLKEILLSLEEDSLIHFVPSPVQLAQIRDRAANLEASKVSPSEDLQIPDSDAE